MKSKVSVCRTLGVILRGTAFLILFRIFFSHPKWCAGKKLDLLLIILALLSTFVPYFRDRIHWSDWSRHVLSFVLVIFGPLGIFQLIEIQHKRGIYEYLTYESCFHTTVLYNYILIFSIFLILYVVCNRIRLSMFLTFLLLMGFSIANFYVYKFRGEPILAADLPDLVTAANVAREYSYDLTYRLFFPVFSIPCVWALLLTWPEEKKRPHGKIRIVTTVLTLSFSCFFLHLFAMTDFMQNKKQELKMFESYRSYKKYGEVLTMTWSFRYFIVTKPDGYSVSALQSNVADKYSSDPVITATEVTEDTPNVIFIMNESFTDYDAIGDTGSSEDLMPFIHSLKGKDNAIVGNLYTEGYGGKTANTEYEVMTGSSLSALPAACVAYTVYVKDILPTINWIFNDIGYSGIYGYHPYKASGYRRNTIYPMLGFQNTLFLEDIESQTTEDDYLRHYLTDRADYRFLIDLYEKTRQTTDAPFYTYNVTMQNHSNYLKSDDRLDLSITLREDLASYSRAPVYTNLLPHSDQAFQELTEYFENVDEPTVLVFFGDHEPAISNSFLKELVPNHSLSKENLFEKYHVPLIIWANYDINPNGIHNSEFEKLSTNYLGVKVMKLLNLPLTGYQKYLLDVYEELPITSQHGFLTSDGEYISMSDTSTPYYQRIHEYNSLVYNFQFDSKHHLENFYYLDGISADDHQYKN